MSYIYGRRATCDITPLVASLREELYTEPYESIDWNKARNQVMPSCHNIFATEVWLRQQVSE